MCIGTYNVGSKDGAGRAVEEAHAAQPIAKIYNGAAAEKGPRVGDQVSPIRDARRHARLFAMQLSNLRSCLPVVSISSRSRFAGELYAV